MAFFLKITSFSLDTSDQEQSNGHGLFTESIKQIILHDLTPLQVTPVSPSPPPSITDESSALPSIFTNIERVNNPYDDIPGKLSSLDHFSVFYP
jgi:hypothetical protein